MPTEGELNLLKDDIERMSKCHQIEVLRILHTDSEAQITENSNGSFINLGKVSAEGLSALRRFKAYVDKQQNCLMEGETERARLATQFFGGIKGSTVDNDDGGPHVHG